MVVGVVENEAQRVVGLSQKRRKNGVYGQSKTRDKRRWSGAVEDETHAVVAIVRNKPKVSLLFACTNQ